MQNAKIYSSFIKNHQDEAEISGAEQSPISRSHLQQNWSIQIAAAIDTIADRNPYLPILKPGEVVPAVEAATFAQRDLDCRPQLFDGISKSWKLVDTGSMLTVIRKSPGDRIDRSKVLQAVNGSNIQVYGQKEENKLGSNKLRL